MKTSSGPLRGAVIVALVVVAVSAALALNGCGSTADKNIPAAAAATKDAAKWADAVKSNGLDGTLNGTGPFTAFASSDAAMNAAGAGKVTADVQKAMIIEGTAFSKADLAKGAKNGSMLDKNDVTTYTGSDGLFYMNAMKVIAGPIQAKNGVIYIVDGVVTPK